MLWFAAVLVLLWLAGMLASNTLGGFLHLLLILAFASVVIGIQDRQSTQ